jgi:antitoxin component YwqK of YwqJK toxin-antitoxin module
METFYKSSLLVLIFLNVFCVCAQNDFNKLDEKGNKHGLWKGIYEDTKNPKYEGTFEHGKEIGVFTFFDNTRTKTIVATREFSPKTNEAYTIFYDQSKNKVSEGKVVNKLFEGRWHYYHKASKAIMTIENYTNGKLEGLRSVFYLNGKIAEEINYKNNLKDGICKRYTETGIVIEESAYKNNEYNGVATFKDSEGNRVSNGNFVNGKKAGVWQFFEKGKLLQEEDMSAPQRTSEIKNN